MTSNEGHFTEQVHMHHGSVHMHCGTSHCFFIIFTPWYQEIEKLKMYMIYIIQLKILVTSGTESWSGGKADFTSWHTCPLRCYLQVVLSLGQVGGWTLPGTLIHIGLKL